jgi:phosphoribosylformylglycinamidine synthase
MLAGGLGNIKARAMSRRAQINPGDKLIVLGGPAMNIGLGGGAASSMASGSGQRGSRFRQRAARQRRDGTALPGGDRPLLGAWARRIRFPSSTMSAPAACQMLCLNSSTTAAAAARFNLRAVPNDEPSMSPLEIWCNESQERYVLAVPADRIALFRQLCERERAAFAVVGEATEAKQLVVKDPHFGNTTPIDLPLEVLLGKPPRMHRQERTLTRRFGRFFPSRTFDSHSAKRLSRVLSHPTVADKTFLISIGDRTVGGLICRDQMVGPWQVPVADCAVTAAAFDVTTGEAMAMGERTPVAVNNAAASARLAVGEALTNLAAAQIGDLGKVNLSANWMAAPAVPGDGADLYAAVQAVGMELCPALGITIPGRQGLDEHEHRLAGRGGKEARNGTGVVDRVGVRGGGGCAAVADAAAKVGCGQGGFTGGRGERRG